MKDTPIAILGAGLMGCAIAAAFLKSSFRVILYDVSTEMLNSSSQRILAELQAQNVDCPDKLLTHFEKTDEVGTLRGVDCFIETVTEKIRVKQKLYRQLEPLFHDQTLLLSNTSTISIGELARFVSIPQRFCGFHFFHPVRERSLLEIVRGPESCSETIDQAMTLAKAIDKIPLVVNDGPAFLVNRLLNPYLSGALQLLLEGVSLDGIDAAALEYGMAMGPFRIMDEIGLDVTMHGGWTLYKAFPDRVSASPVLLEMVRRGEWGRKTGIGFRSYSSPTLWDTVGEKNPELDLLVERLREERKIVPRNCTPMEIVDCLINGMRDEGRRVLNEKIVDFKEDVNRAVTLGLGYPADGPPFLD